MKRFCSLKTSVTSKKWNRLLNGQVFVNDIAQYHANGYSDDHDEKLFHCSNSFTQV
jgi:hypothetical protein